METLVSSLSLSLHARRQQGHAARTANPIPNCKKREGERLKRESKETEKRERERKAHAVKVGRCFVSSFSPLPFTREGQQQHTPRAILKCKKKERTGHPFLFYKRKREFFFPFPRRALSLSRFLSSTVFYTCCQPAPARAALCTRCLPRFIQKERERHHLVFLVYRKWWC